MPKEQILKDLSGDEAVGRLVSVFETSAPAAEGAHAIIVLTEWPQFKVGFVFSFFLTYFTYIFSTTQGGALKYWHLGRGARG